MEAYQGKLKIVSPAGYFRFSEISLDPGVNLFHATATDDSGNTSPPSEKISLSFATGPMPDLEVTPDDIVIDPPAPIAGERVSVTVSVRNKGLAQASGAVLEIHHEDPQGNLKLIKSEAIPSLSVHSEKSFSVSFDTERNIGTNAVVAILDPTTRSGNSLRRIISQGRSSRYRRARG